MNKNDSRRLGTLKLLKDESGGMVERVMMILFTTMALAIIFTLLGRAMFRAGHEGETSLLGKLGTVVKQALGYREDNAEDIGVVASFFKWLHGD